MTKILLAEDDPMLQDIYLTKFQEVGFDVVLAEDGQKVLPSIAKTKPDLVLLDIVLPLKDGWEVLSEIRKNHTWDAMKIAVLSNIGEPADVEKAFSMGANLYLIKAHFTPSQVVEEITKLLKSEIYARQKSNS